MSCEVVRSLLAVVFSELFAQGGHLGVEPADLVVHVLDALVLGIVAGSLGARQGWCGVTMSGDFEVEIGLTIKPGTGHPGGFGDGGHGEWQSIFVESSDSGDCSLAGVS